MADSSHKTIPETDDIEMQGHIEAAVHHLSALRQLLERHFEERRQARMAEAFRIARVRLVAHVIAARRLGPIVVTHAPIGGRAPRLVRRVVPPAGWYLASHPGAAPMVQYVFEGSSLILETIADEGTDEFLTWWHSVPSRDTGMQR